MNRMLIIAACGLILALIIGATTQSREKRETTQDIFHNDKKCRDTVDIKEGECSYDTLDVEIILADMFLRNIKRKQRMMYA